MGVQDLAQQKRVREARQKRLDELEVIAAKMGVDTPPHITIEIGSLKKELEIRETVVTSPIAAKLADELGPDGRFIYSISAIEQMSKRIDSGFQLFSEWIERVEVRAEERTQAVDVLRDAGQRANRTLILVVGGTLILFMVAVGVVLFVLVQDLAAIRSVGR